MMVEGHGAARACCLGPESSSTHHSTSCREKGSDYTSALHLDNKRLQYTYKITYMTVKMALDSTVKA